MGLINSQSDCATLLKMAAVALFIVIPLCVLFGYLGW